MPGKEEQRQIQIKSAMIQEAKENCEYFIEEFIYIENKDGDEPVIKFHLWPLQKVALGLMLIWRWLIFLKARQLGCTWLVLSYSLWLMLHPGKKVIALSKTEIDANALVQRVELMLRHLPDWFIKRSSVPDPLMMTFDSTATWVKVRHPGGEDSIFMSLPAAQNSGASLTADLVIADEWGLQEWAEQIYRAAFPTINRKNGGQFFGISTMRIGSFFHKMCLGALHGTNDYKLIFWPWNTDPSRDDEWYQRTQRNYDGNMHSDYPATIEEALSQADGCFFNELLAEVHAKPKQPVPSYYQRFASIDYGLDGLAVIWYYVDRQGYVRAYRELYTKDKTIPVAAQLIKTANAGDDIAGFFAPPDLWLRRQETGKPLTETFAELGIYLTKANARREQGWEAVKELLRPITTINEQTGAEYTTARLTFDEGATPELWRCLATIQRDPKNYNEVQDRNEADHELTHLVDSLRYFASSRTYPSTPHAIRDDADDERDGGDYDDFLKYGT